MRFEMNFDGLIGPSHHYGGLAKGNLASAAHAEQMAYPKEAALQGIAKMRTLVRLGYRQGFLPPQQRPRLDILRQLGFSGSDEQILTKAHATDPKLLSHVYSASSMWAANAATVTPSLDSHDGKLHLTPANLLSSFHRSFEHQQTTRILNAVFNNSEYFVVHPALYSQPDYADEGAANHTRLSSDYGETGVGLFVYGRDANKTTQRFPARQTLAASEAIARQHGVRHARFLRQSAEAIDAGAFHNDVVAVGNGPVLFFHEKAFDPEQQETVFAQLKEQMAFMPICVPETEVPLTDAISSYLFNSQLLSAPDGDMSRMCLIAPSECLTTPSVTHYLDKLTKDSNNPIESVTFVDVRQSMSNGGGPACLRLRVQLSEKEYQAINPVFIATEAKLDALETWVHTHYREQLSFSDLVDPAFLQENLNALEALTELLELKDFYPFQSA